MYFLFDSIVCVLAKAVDTVNHNILNAKLLHYSIDGTPLQLIRSYLIEILKEFLPKEMTSSLRH